MINYTPTIMTKQNQSGFTILELMIVVAIAGVLSVIALPYMQDVIANQRIRAGVTDMHLSLLLARSEAIKRNANMNIVRTGGTWTGGWTVQVASDATVLRTTDALPDDITIDCNTDADTAAEACPTTVTFTRTGRPSLTSPDTLIEYRLYENGNPRVWMRCVSVSLSGRPEVKVDGDTDTTDGCG
jgi:type IV fimbrial biogenesis protein FimT